MEGRETPKHDVMLAFTRMLAGPMDYTPGGFDNLTWENFTPRNREIVDAGNGRCVGGAGNGVGRGAKDGHGSLAATRAGNGDDRVSRGFVGHEGSGAKVETALREVAVIMVSQALV